MIRSVNIFKSTSERYPIRIEFWDTDKLVTIYEVDSIPEQLANEIMLFIISKPS